MSDPIQRFLGVQSSADAHRMLALTPGQSSPRAVERALQAQLDRVNRHPDSQSKEAEFVRLQLKSAAAAILSPPNDGTPAQTIQRQSAQQPISNGPTRQQRKNPPAAQRRPQPQQRKAAPQRTTQPQLALTTFDRSVLAVLVACGGWNARSRAKLVALASANHVSPGGLMKVIQGLSEYARHGDASNLALPGRGQGRIGMSQITQGAARFEAPGLVAPRDVPQPTASADWLPEVRETSVWGTIKLSLLFGSITIAGFAFLLSIFLKQAPGNEVIDLPDTPNSPPRIPTISDNSSTDQTNTENNRTPDNGATNVADTSTPRLAHADKYPTFRHETLSPEITYALEQSPRLPDLIDTIERHLIVTDTPSLATYQDWKVYMGEAGLMWVLADPPTVDATRKKIYNVLFEAADSPSMISRLLNELAGHAAMVASPEDIWQGAWAMQLLGEFASAESIPDTIVRTSRDLIDDILITPIADGALSSNRVANAWLLEQVPELIANTNIDNAALESWERWLQAAERIDADGSFERDILAATFAMLKSSHDLAGDRNAAKVFGRLVSEIDLHHSIDARDTTLRAFEFDQEIPSRNLWVLTSLLAARADDDWFDETLVLAADAESAGYRTAVQRLGQHWPIENFEDTTQSLAAGSAIVVDRQRGRLWQSLVESDIKAADQLSQPIEQRPQRLMQRLLRTARLNNAAFALAEQEPIFVDSTLAKVQAGWSFSPNTNRTNDTSSPGNSRGPDGTWSEVYESAGRDLDQRLNLLDELRNAASTDLGPIDAATVVSEAYASPASAVRERAQGLVIEVFARGPNVVLQLLDHLPDVPARPRISEFLERVTARNLPESKDPDWMRQTRMRLIRHYISLKDSPGREFDAMATALIDSWQSEVALSGPATTSQSSDRLGADVLRELVSNLRSQASTTTARVQVPGSVSSIDRSLETRRSLAEGPIESALAERIAVLELLAYLTVAEQPVLADAVKNILNESSQARGFSEHILDQAVKTELTILRVWRLRIEVPGDVSRHDDVHSQDHGPVQGHKFIRRASWTPHVLHSTEPPEFTARLAALSPDDPRAYFELGEEVADVAEDIDTRQLARELFSRAAVINPKTFGRSAALALADLETKQTRKRRLLALAHLLDDRQDTPNWLASESFRQDIPADAALELSEVFSFYRRGMGSRVESKLADSNAGKLLKQIAPAIGGERRFLENATRYRTGISPIKTDNELMTMLQLEIAMLAGENRPWSSELLLRGGRTLVEVNPERLADSFEVDGDALYYRNGDWVAGE